MIQIRLVEESEAHIEEQESEEQSEEQSEEESEENSESHIEEEESEDPLVSENVQHVAVPLVQHRQPDNPVRWAVLGELPHHLDGHAALPLDHALRPRVPT